MRQKKRADKNRENGKGRVDTPISELGEKDTIMHYNAVLIEELNSKMQLVIESMQATAKQLGDKMDAMRAELIDKMEMVRLELRSMIRHHDCRLTALEANQ